jgi:hypothetical protein
MDPSGSVDPGSQSKGASTGSPLPHPDQAHFKHMELIASRGRQVLMVTCLNGRRDLAALRSTGRARQPGAIIGGCQPA